MPNVRGFGRIGEKGKGRRSTNWSLQNSHGDTKYNIENIGGDIAITMCGVR